MYTYPLSEYSLNLQIGYKLINFHMIVRQDKTKKFHRKKHFLQISLLKFTRWRDVNNDFSSNEKNSFDTKYAVEKTVEQELLLIRNFFRFSRNDTSFFNKLSTNTFLEKKNQKEVNNSSILSTFFPQRRAFMYYWVLPFVGFVGLTFLNQNNQFKFYPSLELWPYLRKIAPIEKKPTRSQNNNEFEINTSYFSRYEENKVFPLSWETLEYLNYKKCLSDQSKKYVNRVYASEDNLRFIVEPNWVEHQKNQYFITFKDFTMSNRFETMHSSENFRFSEPIDLEKKEIENLCKLYFYETRNFIYSPLRKVSDTQISSYTPNSIAEVRTKMNTADEALNSVNNFTKKVMSHNQKDRYSQKKLKGGFLENILALNLWNRSSIFWYWYQINPSEMKNSFISGDPFSFSKISDFHSKKTTFERNDFWFWKSHNQAQKQKPKQLFSNECRDIIRKKSLSPEFYSQMNFITRRINSLENNWLNLDEFPKKIFPITIDSISFRSVDSNNSSHTTKFPLQIKNISSLTPKNIYTNEPLIYDEKDLTLGFFLDSNFQPIQSYQKSSLLLDNFMKKLQLERKFYPPQNSFDNYEIIKQKKNFASIIETKLKKMHKLKYRYHMSSSCFSPKIFRSDLLKAYDMSKTRKSSKIQNMNFLSPVNSLLFSFSHENYQNSPNTFFVSNHRLKKKSSISNTNNEKTLENPRIKLKIFSKKNIKTENSLLSNVFVNTSVKKRIAKNLQKIFYGKYLSFKIKKILNTNQNSVSVPKMPNHFDVSKATISHDENLTDQFKRLNSYRQFIKQKMIEPTYLSLESSLWSTKGKKNSFENRRFSKQQRVKNSHVGKFLSLLRKNQDTTKKFEKSQLLKKDIYELSLLYRLTQQSKKRSSSSMEFGIEPCFTPDLKKHDDNSQNDRRMNRTNFKIQRLSYNNRNFHLNDSLKKTFLSKQNDFDSKNTFFGQTDVFSINFSPAPNKLKNPLVMSGYEFPEFRIKDVFSYTNSIRRKMNENSKKEKNLDIELMVSLPPIFYQKMHFLQQNRRFSKKSISNSVDFENFVIKSDQNCHEIPDLVANQTRHRLFSPTVKTKRKINDFQGHEIAIKKQNSFLFQSRDDFFTLFKQSSVSNSNVYWSQLVDRDNRKNSSSLNIENFQRKKRESTTLLKHRMNESFRNEFFYQKKRWIQHLYSKINSFYEYFRQNLRSLFMRLNILWKRVLTRIQHKLLDQHDFDFYLTFDSLTEFSNESKENEKETEKQLRTKMTSNIKEITIQKERLFKKSFKTSRVLSETPFFQKTQNEKKIKTIPSIFYFKKLENFDRKNLKFAEEQIKSIESRNSETEFPRIFKLNKTKKCLKNSVLFKNVEKRKVEKIFRTYLSCKANETSSKNERTIASKHDAFEIEMTRKKSMNKKNVHSRYIANALKRLQIRVKHNLLISKKNILEKSIEMKKNDSGINTRVQNEILNNTYVFDSLRTEKSDIKNHAIGSKNQKTLFKKYDSMKLYQNSPNNLLRKLGFIFLNRSDKAFSQKNHRLSSNKLITKKSFSEVSKKVKLKETASTSELALNDVTHKIHESFSPNDNTENGTYSTRHEKQKYRQIKRRRKKQKLQNRRRKKRKRVHPRPKWLRFQLYNNFLKKRHFKHHLNCDFDSFEAIGASNFVRNNHFEIKTITQNSPLSDLSTKNNSSSLYEFETKVLYKPLKTKIYRQNKQQWGVSENPNFEKLTIKKLPLARSLPIFANHELYRISNAIMSDFQRLCWKSYWFRSNLTPYIHRIQSSLKKLQLSQIHEQSSTTLKTFLLHFLGTTSPQRALIDNNDISNYIMNKTSDFLTAEKSPRVSWYVNVRQSFQNRNAIANFSLFQKTQEITEYNRILYERISDIIKNVRVNLNANGQNHARSFKRGRYKKHRAAKKVDDWWTRFRREFSSEIRALSSLASPIQTSSQSHGDLPTLRVLWALNKMNIYEAPNALKQNNAVKNLWETQKNRERKKSNKTKKFLSKSWKKIFPENFEKYCFRKAVFVEDKIRYSGFIKKDYENYLIRLKMRFKRLHFSPRSPNLKKIAFDKNNLNSLVNTKQKINELLAPQKLVEDKAKRSMFFWWTSFSPKQWESIFMQQNFASLKIFDFQMNSFMTQSASGNFAIFNSLWICTILFHVCSLFFVLNIPEIRSLMKFNLLIFYKIASTYLIVIYSIYDLLKNYKNQIIHSFAFVYPSLINNTTRFFSRNKLMTTSHSKTIGISAKYKKTSKKYVENRKFSKKKDIKDYVHYENKRKSEIVHQNIHYLSNNSVFLEMTFRTPAQLHENSILSILVEPSDKNNENETKLIIKPIRRIAKIKALCDSIRLEILNRIIAKGSIFKNNKNLDAGEVTLENPKFWSLPFGRQKVKNTNELNQIVTNENSSKKQIYSYVLSAELESKKFRSIVSLILFEMAKLSIVIIDNCIRLCYKTLFKCIDVLESVMMIIYKFLEKPAELIIDWIANIFLVEWSSDITTYLPEALDSSIWNAYVLSSRSTKLMGPFGFLLQRRLWCFMEIFIDFVSKPDADLSMRQTKGTIFWNIWAEILIQAAERYNINVQSLTTLKEEQELLIEKLLDDENWDSLWSIEGKALEKTSTHKTREEMIPFINMIENERPRNWWNSIDLNDRTFSFGVGPSKLENSISNQISPLKDKSENQRTKIFVKVKPSDLKRDIRPIIRFCHKGLLKDIKQAQKIHSTASDIWRRWSANQHLTYQGKDTDLFIEIHPPKSFRHMTAIKYYQPAQQTLGSLVCQIYSGTFSKQVSKNILVVGAPGIGKSLLVQALAGETELKIITDNAHRYALVQSGVAVGIKLLRDVFDAIALHTPCLFLMEDIHVIGERRPMLISDDENAKATESFFASETEEVHEKNQLIYQLNRHALSHYKKPYRGDFSLLIPTNHFCFDLFLGVSPPKTRRSGMTPKSPLEIESIENKIDPAQNEASLERSFMNTALSRNKRFPFETLVSHLQISSEKYFAPPPTSPFTILMMKEQKKLVPKKLVKQMPWSGLSWDQMMLVSKVNYSIRVKVALLTEIAMRNLSVKLDMITDLLVIMDSVRSNRGFVVFATTHAPFVLDPALRRPGRLDETISLPSLPSLINRWEIFKTNLSSFTNTLDFVDYGLLSANLTDTQISDFIAKSKLLLFNTTVKRTIYTRESSIISNHRFAFDLWLTKGKTRVFPFSPPAKNFSETEGKPKAEMKSMAEGEGENKAHARILSNTTNKNVSSLNQAIKITINADIIEPFQITKRVQKALMKSNKNKRNENSFLEVSLKQSIEKSQKVLLKQNQRAQRPNSLLRLLRSFDVYPSIPKSSSNLISLTYFQMGKFLIDSCLLSDQTSYGRITWSKLLAPHNFEEQIFRDLYGARFELKNVLMRLFSGKVGEFFIFNNSSLCRYSYSFENRRFSKNNEMNDSEFQHIGFWNLVGIHPFWNSANSFVSSLMQKRYLYNKNLLISRMLYFEDLSARREPPSPPNSSISMPAKKYENLKRTENDFQQKATMSIHEKIQLHQQQRLMKKLYNRPINEYFRSEMIENRFTKFSSSMKELGYLNSFVRRPSSVNCYYRNRILIRHQFSLLNQWWNGQLAEYSTETTFLSDVDWRSIFNKSLGDLLIDFPDADQHYNPRHRRWFLQSSYWGYWNTFDKTMTEEISYHFMIQCFNKAYNFLNNEREILDYFAHYLLQKGILNEIHLITTLSRFYNSPTTILK